MKRRRSSVTTPATTSSTMSADAVVAATAGEDSWKTWAGRSHGSSEMEWMDLVRGSKRTLEKGIASSWLLGTLFPNASLVPPPGTVCPVCYCEPDVWHITSSCSHAVCLDCLRGYAASQVRDPSHVGPLKCPVCPQVLRRKDAMIALMTTTTTTTTTGNDNHNNGSSSISDEKDSDDSPPSSSSSSLIRQWDEKIRNQRLRALPSYRPCPHCSTKAKSSGTTTQHTGGGFVTPSCLAPQYQERRDEASRLLRDGLTWAVGGLTLVYMIWATFISNFPSVSPLVDLFVLLIPLVVTTRPNFQYVRRYFAQQARDALFRPISVECPCCDGAFILPNTSADIVDAESKQWIDRHARACPSCSAPISKMGGCNHMACPNCHANFCWACMQLRSTCRAYQCTNGARYGNAAPPLVPVGGPNGDGATATTVANDSVEDSLLNRIDAILNSTTPTSTPTSTSPSTASNEAEGGGTTTPTTDTRRTRTAMTSSPYYSYWYTTNGAILWLGLFGRFSPWIQAVIEPVMTVLAAIFAATSGTILSSWLLVGVLTAYNMVRLRDEQQRYRHGQRHGQRGRQGQGRQHQREQRLWWEQQQQQQQRQRPHEPNYEGPHEQVRRRRRPLHFPGMMTASEFWLGADEEDERRARGNGNGNGGGGGDRDQRRGRPGVFDFRGTQEDEMIREALRRSLQEQ